jgi:putative hydrolase of the HAD superfamily
MKRPDAVTFDFFRTLVRPAGGRTRGEAYCAYLDAARIPHAPWQHRMLYDIFQYYSDAYDPALTARGKQRFWQAFAKRLFVITGVPMTREADIAPHCGAVEDIFSSRFLHVFGDVHDTLGRLAGRGLTMAVLSNWPGGLAHFCEELGLSGYFRFCLASSDFGREKPDPAIFREAVRRLACEPGQVMHVGDSLTDDIEGAGGAGLRPVLIDRDGLVEHKNITTIRSLDQLEEIIFAD